MKFTFSYIEERRKGYEQCKSKSQDISVHNFMLLKNSLTNEISLKHKVLFIK